MRLHERLALDFHLLGETATGLVLLHQNASLPWLVLVPDTDETALYRLPAPQRAAVEATWNGLAEWVHERFVCDRVNMAAIGNMVPQLHLHVVGRHVGDPCWPGVVWGREVAATSWTAEQIESVREALRDVIGLVAG